MEKAEALVVNGMRFKFYRNCQVREAWCRANTSIFRDAESKLYGASFHPISGNFHAFVENRFAKPEQALSALSKKVELQIRRIEKERQRLTLGKDW